MHTNTSEIVWGIIGCGYIANTFAESFTQVSGGSLYACAASDQGRARSFAQRHNIVHVHDNYQALYEDASIDAVYIATTHNFHFEQIMACLQHNKHVLCEKPLTLNAKQAQQVKAAAAEQKCLVIEAVWTRFLPAIVALKHSLNEGVIGRVKSVYANFSINPTLSDEHRLLNPNLAGGALLDLGIYPITMADIVFESTPVKATASATMSRTGVDEGSHYMLEYNGGKTALLSSSCQLNAPVEALIYGDKGHIRVPQFLGAKSFEVCMNDQDVQRFEFDFDSAHCFRFEIQHFHDCLAQGLLDSPVHPLSKTLSIMQLMDELRSQFGLVYPNE